MSCVSASFTLAISSAAIYVLGGAPRCIHANVKPCCKFANKASMAVRRRGRLGWMYGLQREAALGEEGPLIGGLLMYGKRKVSVIR